MLNVRDFGATGTGASGDDAPYLQAVLDAAEAAPIGAERTVYVPPGDYPIQAILKHPSNVSLVCSPYATIYRNGAISGLILFKTTGGGYSGVQNVRLTGGVWEANFDSFPFDGNLVVYGHATGVHISDLTIRGAKTHHIEVNACTHVRIRNVICEDWRGGVREAIQIDAAISSSVGDFAPFDGTPCQDVEVSGCTFRGNISRAIGTHSSSQGHRDIRILDNYVDSPSAECFNLLDYIDPIISGNRVKGGTVGVDLKGCTNALVTGNHLTGMSVACVAVDQGCLNTHISRVSNILSPAQGGAQLFDSGNGTITDVAASEPPPPPPPAVLTQLVLVNPDADQGTTGWTNTMGALTIKNSPIPPWGGTFFYGGPHAETRASQIVAIPETLWPAVDDGLATVVAGGWQGSAPSAGDKAQLMVDALDTGGAVIGAQLSTPLQLAPTGWKEIAVEGVLPVGTRSIRLWMRMTRQSGTNNDGYLDRLTLAIRTPT